MRRRLLPRLRRGATRRAGRTRVDPQRETGYHDALDFGGTDPAAAVRDLAVSAHALVDLLGAESFPWGPNPSGANEDVAVDALAQALALARALRDGLRSLTIAASTSDLPTPSESSAMAGALDDVLFDLAGLALTGRPPTPRIMADIIAVRDDLAGGEPQQ